MNKSIHQFMNLIAVMAMLLGGSSVRKAAAVIGPSLGGMTVLAYCALFPDEVRSLVTISAAARSTARPPASTC